MSIFVNIWLSSPPPLRRQYLGTVWSRYLGRAWSRYLGTGWSSDCSGNGNCLLDIRLHLSHWQLHLQLWQNNSKFWNISTEIYSFWTFYILASNKNMYLFTCSSFSLSQKETFESLPQKRSCLLNIRVLSFHFLCTKLFEDQTYLFIFDRFGCLFSVKMTEYSSLLQSHFFLQKLRKCSSKVSVFSMKLWDRFTFFTH